MFSMFLNLSSLNFLVWLKELAIFDCKFGFCVKNYGYSQLEMSIGQKSGPKMRKTCFLCFSKSCFVFFPGYCLEIRSGSGGKRRGRLVGRISTAEVWAQEKLCFLMFPIFLEISFSFLLTYCLEIRSGSGGKRCGRLIGRISTTPGTWRTSWCRVMIKKTKRVNEY